MRFRYINFIENWLVSHVTEADDYGTPERAEELAARLRADAIAQGVTPDDMEADSGSLEALIYETMHHAFDPVLPGLERQVARIRRQMDLLLEMLDDLKSHNTTIGQWRDGKLVDVTNEWITECEMKLDLWQGELETALNQQRERGGDFTV